MSYWSPEISSIMFYWNDDDKCCNTDYDHIFLFSNRAVKRGQKSPWPCWNVCSQHITRKPWKGTCFDQCGLMVMELKRWKETVISVTIHNDNDNDNNNHSNKNSNSDDNCQLQSKFNI